MSKLTFNPEFSLADILQLYEWKVTWNILLDCIDLPQLCKHLKRFKRQAAKYFSWQWKQFVIFRSMSPSVLLLVFAHHCLISENCLSLTQFHISQTFVASPFSNFTQDFYLISYFLLGFPNWLPRSFVFLWLWIEGEKTDKYRFIIWILSLLHLIRASLLSANIQLFVWKWSETCHTPNIYCLFFTGPGTEGVNILPKIRKKKRRFEQQFQLVTFRFLASYFKIHLFLFV